MNKKTLMLFLALIVLVYGCTGQVVKEIKQQSLEEKKNEEKQAIQETLDTTADIPKIALTNFPMTVKEKQTFYLTWQIDTKKPQIATHTAMHFDTKSHSGELTTSDGHKESQYFKLTTKYASGSFDVPAKFSDTITVPEGASKLYLRAHAIIEGRNYWTDEIIIDVPKKEQPKSTVKEFTISADEERFEPSTITVNKGEKVRITFRFNDDEIYFGGLDVKSDFFNVAYRKSDSKKSKTVQFTADKSFSYSGYWPQTSKLKATGKVEIV